MEEMLRNIIESIRKGEWFEAMGQILIFLIIFGIIYFLFWFFLVRKSQKCLNCGGFGTTKTLKGIEICPRCLGTGKPNKKRSFWRW